MFSPKEIPLKGLGEWSKLFIDKLDKHASKSSSCLEYFSDFYKLLSDIKDGIDERNELLQFLKDILHNEKLFHENNIQIKLGNNKTYKYSLLRRHLYLSLFALIGGVYDSSARLCYLALNKEDGIKKDCYIHNLFFANDKMTKGHQDIIGPLKKTFGYYLGIIIFLRNLFVHRGESILCGVPLFQSDYCSDFDSLNPDALTTIETEANNCYEIKKFQNQRQDIKDIKVFGQKRLLELVKTYLSYSDQAIGVILNSLFGKHLGVV